MDTESLQQGTLFDEHGVPIVYARECQSFPEQVLFPITKTGDLTRINNLVSQSVQGVINTHGRTIELVFSAEVQKGLNDGSLTMMKTSTGEVLADAVHKSGAKAGHIAGKGRVVEGGKLKQLATGSFQVVSLIVAQAHLEDINKNLIEIKNSVDSLHKKWDEHSIATIEGRINYLEGLIEKFRRDDFNYDMSLQIKNKIEDTVADAYKWQAILLADVKLCESEVDKLMDSDMFGTGDTYQKLKSISESILPLVVRRSVLLKMASLLAYIQACVDPMEKEFSRFDLRENVWSAALNNLSTKIKGKANQLLSKAKFNSQEILEHRRFYISKTLESTNDNALHNYEQFQSSLIKLKNNHRKVLSENGKLRLVVSHNDNGQVLKAAIVD